VTDQGGDVSAEVKGSAVQHRSRSPRRRTDAPPAHISWPAAKHLLDEWHLRITTAQFGHQLQAERTHNWNLILGIPVVIATTIVGTAAFAAINNTATNDRWKFAAGVVSIGAAVLAALQTFFGFGDRSERHRIAATRYAVTRRSIELALAKRDTQSVDRIRIDMDRIGGPSPQIGQKRWGMASEIAKEQIARWEHGETDLEQVSGEQAPGPHAGRRSHRSHWMRLSRASGRGIDA
jgi:hypothetical protein